MSSRQRIERQALQAEKRKCISRGGQWSELRNKCVTPQPQMITGVGSMGGHGMRHMGKRKSDKKTCRKVRVKAHKSKTVKGRRFSVRSHKRRIC